MVDFHGLVRLLVAAVEVGPCSGVEGRSAHNHTHESLLCVVNYLQLKHALYVGNPCIVCSHNTEQIMINARHTYHKLSGEYVLVLICQHYTFK